MELSGDLRREEDLRGGLKEPTLGSGWPEICWDQMTICHNASIARGRWRIHSRGNGKLNSGGHDKQESHDRDKKETQPLGNRNSLSEATPV